LKTGTERVRDITGKKAIDPVYDGQYQVQESPWRFLRYSEIILSYAEACRELGEDDEARTYLNMIRKRVGLPSVTSSGGQLRQDIRHERRIELVFEDQRYFDIRRWMIAPQVIVDAEGIDIRYHTGESGPVYSVINIQQREWKDRSYLTLIKLDEINRNNLLYCARSKIVRLWLCCRDVARYAPTQYTKPCRMKYKLQFRLQSGQIPSVSIADGSCPRKRVAFPSLNGLLFRH
jgi:hypothetical protein